MTPLGSPREVALELTAALRDEVAPQLGSYPGKGEALWKSLLVTKGDIVVFVDADQVATIRERGVDLKLDAAEVAGLPRPDPAPPTYRADPAADRVKTVTELLGRIAERFGKRDGWKRSR